MIKKYSAVFVLLSLFSTGVFAQCTANFSYSTNGLFNYGFINLSSPFSGPGITYQWDFGDGTTSTLENPSHTFDSLGTYNVCMTFKDTTFNCTVSRCTTIVIACPAVAGFNYTRGTDYSYDFNYTSSSNDTVTWHWNFGDGDTSNLRDVSHTFASTGTYLVCLTVTDVNIHCTSDTCQYVSICVAEADFTHTNSTRFDYSFTNASVGTDASTTYEWSFGDGDSSTAESPSHTYTEPGTYDVCLTIDVVDSGCTNTYCSSISVACLDSANFSSSNIGGLTFKFMDLSTGEDASVTYSWSFGDGTASSEQDPEHLFLQAGTHDVCLTIRNVDQGCTSTFCSTVVIACNDSAGFAYTNTGSTYHFSDLSTGEDTSAAFLWTFGDGGTSTAKNPAHTYASIGTFQVCLKMTDVDVSCSSQYCESITVSCPLASSFTYSSADSAISFTDATTGEDASAAYKWYFGDGDSSSLKNPTHVYGSSGSYHVCLTVENVDMGCSNQSCQEISINIAGCPDIAAFSYSNVRDTFTFQSTSKNVSNSATYLWRFGDNDSSLLQNPVHAYASTGNYDVCLFITDATNSCSSDTCQNIEVSSIAPVSAANPVRLYPNPAANSVNIDLNGFEARNIVVFNQLGQAVKQIVPNNNGLTTIDISTLPAGIYLVSAKSEERVNSATLVVTNK